MRIRAKVLTPSNNTITSSMPESLPLVSQKHARLPRNCHHSVTGQRPDETIFLNNENVLKQRAAYLVGSKTGTADMQIIFDFIWNQSRSRFLATIGEQEVER